MAPPKIETPRGEIVIVRTKQGTLTARLRWNAGFGKRWTKRFMNAQEWLDNEVLATCEKYVPMRTGMLIKSGILGTDIGSGIVSYIAPYARKQYYSPRKVGSVTGPLRGPFWFARAKAMHKHQWLDGAKKIIARDSAK